MDLTQSRSNETAILARVFSDKIGQVHPDMARFILDLGFNDRDKTRLHELVVRNQDDGLAPEEKEELYAFLNANSMLAILKSKARQTLKVEPEKRSVS